MISCMQVADLMGLQMINSDYRNIKITTPEDMNTAEIFIKDTF